ncbi:hypothetical protein ACLOJK_039847 [Asimina triloba]
MGDGVVLTVGSSSDGRIAAGSCGDAAEGRDERWPRGIVAGAAWAIIWGVLAAAQTVSCCLVTRWGRCDGGGCGGVRSDEGGGLLTADGRRTAACGERGRI